MDMRDDYLDTYPRVDLNHVYVGMVVVYDPVPSGRRYAMCPGALATVTGTAPLGYDPGYFNIAFIQPLTPKVPPRNGQSDGAYHMRDFRVVLSSVPQFTTTDQAQAWLDQHTTPFQPGV